MTILWSQDVPGALPTSNRPGTAVAELRERLIAEFGPFLPRRVIDGLLQGYLERYGVRSAEPGEVTLQAVERATRVALAARLSSFPVTAAAR